MQSSAEFGQEIRGQRVVLAGCLVGAELHQARRDYAPSLVHDPQPLLELIAVDEAVLVQVEDAVSLPISFGEGRF